MMSIVYPEPLNKNNLFIPYLNLFATLAVYKLYATEFLCDTEPSCIPKYAVSAIPTNRPVSTNPGIACRADSTSAQLLTSCLSQYLDGIIIRNVQISWMIVPVNNHASIIGDHRAGFCFCHPHLKIAIPNA